MLYVDKVRYYTKSMPVDEVVDKAVDTKLVKYLAKCQCFSNVPLSITPKREHVEKAHKYGGFRTFSVGEQNEQAE